MNQTASQDVLYEEHGAVAVLTLNRPAALNSFTRRMHRDLWAALDKVEANKAIRALVLTGAGRGFCAGADLSEFDFSEGPNLEKRADPGPVIDQAFNPTTRRLLQVRVPTVCAVNGVAAGAGASVAMACDITIAAPTASFIQAFSKIGLVPDCGGTWLLPRLVGRARALGLAMTGDKLPAEDAERIGLIWQCVDDVLLVATVAALADRLAAMPSRALAETRRALDAAMPMDLGDALALEAAAQRRLGAAHDFAEGVAAFFAKRPAVFRDR